MKGLYYLKYLILILFSLSINKDNYNIGVSVIDIPINNITTTNLTKNKSITLNFSYVIQKDLFVSIKSLNDKEFIMTFNESIPQNKKEYKEKINTSYFNEGQLLNFDIISNSDENNTIEIINIVDDGINSEYFQIDNNDKNSVEKYNFVKFIEKDESIKVNINFNNKINASYNYLFVRLSSKDINYIPSVFFWEDKNDDKLLENNKTIEIDYKEKEFKGNELNQYFAFIFSIKPESYLENYTVQIEEIKEAQDDTKMNIFLIVSIVIALVFAVITFFLIRRKKNPKKNEDEFYKENKEDENNY